MLVTQQEVAPGLTATIHKERGRVHWVWGDSRCILDGYLTCYSEGIPGHHPKMAETSGSVHSGQAGSSGRARSIDKVCFGHP